VTYTASFTWQGGGTPPPDDPPPPPIVPVVTTPTPTPPPTPPATDVPDTTPIPEEPIPEATEDEIVGEAIPLDNAENDAAWALINLILCIAGALAAVFTVMRKALRKKDEDGEYGSEFESDDSKRAGFMWLIISVVMGIVGVIFFLMTEDMSNPMALVDKWTIVNLIIFIAGIAGAILTFKNKKDDDESVEMNG
jgi:hypothetical protein